MFSTRKARLAARIVPAAGMCLALGCLMLGGCGPVVSSHNSQDPFEQVNRKLYAFNETLDNALFKPAAEDYEAVVPESARMMVSNFLSNMDDVTVTFNDLLQVKLAQATSDFGRLMTNTTIGIFGTVDIASDYGLEKHHEDFGQTLGRWGVGSGPYLVLPLIGPSTARDGLGFLFDHKLNPLSRHPRRRMHIVHALATRISVMSMDGVLDTALDRYAFLRSFYLQHRQSLVYDGRPPRPDYEEDDPEPDSKREQ